MCRSFFPFWFALDTQIYLIVHMSKGLLADGLGLLSERGGYLLLGGAILASSRELSRLSTFPFWFAL